MPMDPPVFPSQSCGGAPRVAGMRPRPEVMDSSTRIAPSGRRAPIADETPWSVISPEGSCGRSTRSERIDALLRHGQGIGQSRERPDKILLGTGKHVNLGIFRSQNTVLARIREIGYRRGRTHQNELPEFP